MGTASPGPTLEPCPHCGRDHGETLLNCPESGAVLPLEGRMLDGKFRLLRKVGTGGMSTVWKAENVFVRKHVAIKLMHPEFARNARTLARFRNEATAAGRIGSDYICDILDFGQSDLGPYIVMEMLIGQDLGDFVASRGLLDPELAVLIVRQALIGLSAAHRAGIIHRDLKPENVFLHEPQPGRLVVKLMDFGISKFTEEVGDGKTGVGVLMGTPEYMSPEQTEGAAEVDLRTDLWAVGAILYFALTGREAFSGRTLAAVLLAVTTKAHRPLLEVRGDVPEGLSQIIDRCLSKDPAARYASATELSDVLAPYEKGVDLRSAATVFGIAAAAAKAEQDNPNPTQSDSRTVQTLPPASSVTGPGPQAPASPSLEEYSTAAAIAASENSELQAETSSVPTAERAGTRSDELGRPATVGPTGGFAPVRGEGGQTWSNEIEPASPSPGDSWAMGGPGLDDRPERAAGGGGAWFTVLLVLLALAGVGGYMYMHRNDPAPDPETPADTEGQDEVVAAGESSTEETGGPGPTGPTGATEESGTESTESSTSEGDEGSASADSASTDSASTGSASTGSASTGSDSTGGDDDGDEDSGDASSDTGGGDSGGDDPPKPWPDMSKLYREGSLYTTKSALPSTTYDGAVKACRKLRYAKRGRLTKWRIARESEILKFRSSGVSRVKYWARAASSSGTTAPAVNLAFGKTSEESRLDDKVRPFCVSTR